MERESEREREDKRRVMLRAEAHSKPRGRQCLNRHLLSHIGDATNESRFLTPPFTLPLTANPFW